MSVKDMEPQNTDLLECLLRIDREQVLDERSVGLVDRLFKAGLIEQESGRPTLTAAGIERCRSLQHRAAGDKEAAKVLAARASTRDSDEEESGSD